MRLNLPKERIFFAKPPIWKRLLAFLIDLSIINLVIAAPFRNILAQLIPQSQSYAEAYNYVLMNPGVSYSIYVVTFLIAFLALFYFTILEWGIGQTIGKKLLGLWVVQDLGDKSISKNKAISPGFWQCLLRHLIIIPITPFLLLWIVDPMVSVFSKKQQRLSEMITRTKVLVEYRG